VIGASLHSLVAFAKREGLWKSVVMIQVIASGILDSKCSEFRAGTLQLLAL